MVDTHAHIPEYLPSLPRRIFRFFVRKTVPAAVSLTQAHGAGVDALVMKAVGDPLVTRWHLRPGFRAVNSQLRRIRAAAKVSGSVVASDAAEIRAAAAAGTGSVLLGLEGADAIGKHLSRLNELHAAGVRVIVPVHLGDNAIGTTTLPWQGYVPHIPGARRRTSGLTRFGEQVITRMNDLGIVVDVAHADTATLMGMVAASRQPVIASHSGSKEVSGFVRHLSDEEITAVASTGGVIGLWPFHHGGEGVATMDELMRHARHIADIAGPEHLCIGTDMNGIPGAMDGGGKAGDIAAIGEALRGAGFTAAQTRGILGENFLRVLDTVTRSGAGLN